jgi:hypothetical protein
MNKKDKIQLKLTIITISGLVIIGLLFMLNIKQIKDGYFLMITLYGIGSYFYAVMIELILIGCLSSMTIYIYREWFNQKEQYFSDIPFLFGAFFHVLVFGKLLDLLFFLTFFTIEEEMQLILMKARWLVGVLTVLPMLYLSLGMFLYYISLREKYPKFNDKRYRQKIRGRFLILILIIETGAVILAPTFDVIMILLPLFVLPSIIIIVWLFYFSYKNKALSKVNSKILTIGFILIFLLQIIRPLFNSLFGIEGNEAIFYIPLEMFALGTFALIFTGFIKKPSYSVL